MKTAILALAVAFSLSNATNAQVPPLTSMPKKFQGTWADVDLPTCPLFINANTVSYCNPNIKRRLISIESGHELLNMVTVTWLDGPHKIKIVYRLIDAGGRQSLISVNADLPTNIGLYLKMENE